jgi:hypothetical protein
MADLKRALRRRLVWTLVAVVLATATLTGCDDKDQQPAADNDAVVTSAADNDAVVTSGADNDAVVGELTRLSTDWLEGFGAPTSTDPGCRRFRYDVDVTAGTGSTRSDDVEACVLPNGKSWSLRVYNKTGVPITISGRGIFLIWTAQPNATVEIPLTDWHDGDRFTYKPNVVLGAMMVLQEQIKDARVPKLLKPLKCASQPIEDCLVSQAPRFLTKKVTIGHLTVPLQQIAELLANLWEHRDLVQAFMDHVTGEEGGGTLTLTLRQAA